MWVKIKNWWASLRPIGENYDNKHLDYLSVIPGVFEKNGIIHYGYQPINEPEGGGDSPPEFKSAIR